MIVQSRRLSKMERSKVTGDYVPVVVTYHQLRRALERVYGQLKHCGGCYRLLASAVAKILFTLRALQCDVGGFEVHLARSE